MVVTLTHFLLVVYIRMTKLVLADALLWFIGKHLGKKQELCGAAEASGCQVTPLNSGLPLQ